MVSGQSTVRRSGRLDPSQVVIGIEKVTGITPQPSLAAQELRKPAGYRRGLAPAVHVFCPAIPARKVSKVR